MLRKILKHTLQFLAERAIKKHPIKFIVVVGWYGTDLVKEGIYSVLSRKESIRRNTTKLWWDFSVPLIILGYKDTQRRIIRWLAMIIKTTYSLLANPKNPHTIVIDLNMADHDTYHYWSQIITPEIVVVTNYKNSRGELKVHELVDKTKLNGGTILVSPTISDEAFEEFERYASLDFDTLELTTEHKKFSFSSKVPRLVIESYAPVISVALERGFDDDEIIDCLAKLETLDHFTKKIHENLELDAK